MIEHELSRQMHRMVGEYLEMLKCRPPLWGFGDGKLNYVTGVSEEEIAAMEPCQRQSLYETVHHHEMAKEGYLILNDGTYKRLDDLTLEDMPNLPEDPGFKLRQHEAALRLLDFVSRGVQDLQEIGFEVDSEGSETMKLWIRKNRN